MQGWGLSVTIMGFAIDSRGPRFACAVGGLLESTGLLLLGFWGKYKAKVGAMAKRV